MSKDIFGQDERSSYFSRRNKTSAQVMKKNYDILQLFGQHKLSHWQIISFEYNCCRRPQAISSV